MEASRRIAIRETVYILIGVTILTAVMFAVYWLIGRFDLSVLLGGIVGTLLSVGNFFFMSVSATLAADKAEKQDVNGGKRMMQASYPLRILVLSGALLLCGFSGYFDVFALVLPLVFVRPVLTLGVFFRKGGS
ncbi:MAG: hypothetical protein E7453_00610 [Ruminococcaceae bacterium]|nr:hypothetical protein [Oscillospiraceae bacterium]